MKNKIIIIMLILVIVFGTTAYSTETPIITSTSIEDTSIITLTIEDAQKLAIENSYALSSIKRSIGNTEDLINDQKVLQGSIEDLLKEDLQYLPSTITNDYVNTLMITKGYGIKAARVQLVVLTNTLKQTEEALKIGASTSYYNVLLAMETAETNKLTFENAKEHLKTCLLYTSPSPRD